MNDPKTTTLFGGRTVPVLQLDGAAAEVTVRQLPLGDYERAFALADDEIALTAFLCGQPKEWAYALAPESYERLQAAAQEVNAKGFFAWVGRRLQREQAQQQAMLAAMSSLPPDVLKAAIQAGQSISPTSLPKPPPRPR